MAALSTNDRTWLQAGFKIREGAGGLELCTYEALMFDSLNDNAKKLLEELHNIETKSIAATEQSDFEKNRIRSKAIVEKLLKEKVILVESYSC